MRVAACPGSPVGGPLVLAVNPRTIGFNPAYRDSGSAKFGDARTGMLWARIGTQNAVRDPIAPATIAPAATPYNALPSEARLL